MTCKYVIGLFIACIVITTNGNAQRSAAQQNVILNVVMPDARDNDTLHLIVHRNMVNNYEYQDTFLGKMDAVKNNKGVFSFRIENMDGPVYFSLGKEKVTAKHGNYIMILDKYVAEPGDHVTMNVLWDSSYQADKHTMNFASGKVRFIDYRPSLKYDYQYKILFTGAGAPKYQLQQEMVKKLLDVYDDTPDSLRIAASNRVDIAKKVISRYKGRVNPMITQLLLADVTGESYMEKLRFAMGSSARAARIREWLMGLPVSQFSPEVMALSKYYAPYLKDYYALRYRAKQPIDPVYDQIKRDYPSGKLRDRLVAILLEDKVSQLSPAQLDDAVRTVKTPAYAAFVEEMYQALSSSMPAYDFSLTDSTGKLVHLSDFRNKIVFIDFWYTGCGGCSEYYKSVLNRSEEHFANNPDVVFITVSIDRTRDEWMKGVYSGKYTSPKVVNLYTGGEGGAHAVISHYRVHAYPRPLLIDRQGRIITDKHDVLRANGANGLNATIEEALKMKSE